jgi:hypothetical protein
LTITLVSQTNVNCYGDATGAIDISVSGGTPGYTYLWAPSGQTTQDRTGLVAGTYTVTVTDALGCTKTASYTITQPSAPLTITLVSQTNVNCYGDATGAIDISVSGGTPGYTYFWSPSGQTTQDRTGLAAGTYSVTVTDAANCTTTASYTITQPSGPLTITLISQTNVNCYGDATGAIDIFVSGGTPSYTYLWAPSGQTTQDRTGLVAGTYTVTVTDALGCTKTASYTITQPSAPVDVTGVITHVGCSGGNTGAIDVSVTGGTPAYSYLWSNGATTQDLTGLTPGTYTVTVTDSKGCVKTASFTVTGSSAIVITLVTQTNVNCFGDATGALDISVSGGTPGYTYLWSPSGQTTQDRTGLVAGTYTVTVTDAAGCTMSASYTITQPSGPLTVTGVVTHVNCNGGATGAIDVAVSGGTPAYTYLWNTGATTQDLTGLTAGTYTITVTDSKGCTNTQSFTVNQPMAIVITLVLQTNVNCYGDATGAIDISVSGGTPGYTYLWSPSGQTTQDRTGLVAGTYTVTVTDAAGCTKTASYTITQPSAPLTVTGVVTHVNCNGGNTGTIDVSVSGGTPAYSYFWNTGATTQDLTGLVAGTYTVTVTDSKGCTNIQSFTVNQSSSIVITLVSQTNVNCYGNATGAIDISVSGGTPGYTYLWLPSGQTTQDRTGLVAGTYSVTVTDAAGCSKTASYTITQPSAPLEITLVSQTNVNCFGDATGAIDISVSGGTAGYTYLWSPSGQTTQDRTGLVAGTYSVTVTDALGCTKTASYTITQPSGPLTITLVSQTNVNCYGDATGAIDISVSGGTPGYTYFWSPSGQTTQDRTGLFAGTYSVTVTDAANCTKTATYTITQPSAPLAITLVSQTNVNCYGDATGAIDISVSGGTPGYTYLWSPSGQTTQDRTGLTAGTYSVTVTDTKNCTATATYTITQPSAPLAVTAVITHVNCNGGSTGAIDVTVTGGTPAYSYLWNTGATTQDLTGLTAGTYTITVTDSKACTTTQSFTVNQSTPIVITLVSQTNVNCYGDATGAIDISVSGGTPGYTYFWSPSGQTTQDRTGLFAGTYSVTVTDAASCTQTATYTITQPSAPLTITLISQTNVNCYGDATGAIDISVNRKSEV